MKPELNAGKEFLAAVGELDPKSDGYVPAFIDQMLRCGNRAKASDLHLQPTGEGIELRWRIDGVLQLIGVWPASLAPNLVARLKVLANLLTYRTEVPQEGRIADSSLGVEMRLSTFPTLHGEKAVVRIFGGIGDLQRVGDLGLPDDIESALRRLLEENAGAFIVSGPAGSGKTTTIYACLRELAAAAQGSRSLATLEDPIEGALPGVAQSQVNPPAGFDLAAGLRSMLRQDPEVILVGEIRDRETVEGVFQASLTGHLVLTTFHAGSAALAISRLSDMGIEPYLLRSGVLGILCQRLVRRLCQCSTESVEEADQAGMRIARCRLAAGCEQCRGTGYRGRKLLAEMLAADDSDVGRAILSRSDAPRLERLAIEAGMTPLWRRACDAAETGTTSPQEIRRVLGFAFDR